MKNIVFLISMLVIVQGKSQIVIDNTAPYNSAMYLVDDILLGGGLLLQIIHIKVNHLKLVGLMQVILIWELIMVL